MTTHATLEEARQAAYVTIRTIVEIEHEERGRCYIKVKSTLAQLQDAIRRSGKSIPGIVRYIAEHPVMTAEQIEAARVAYLRDNTRCERCATQIDGNTAYSQWEHSRLGGQRTRVIAHYCDSCKALLKAVGAGERSWMEERAADVPSAEPYTKQDW